MEVEVAIRLLYMLGEALPASHGAHFSGDTAKTSALQDMMRTVSGDVLWSGPFWSGLVPSGPGWSWMVQYSQFGLVLSSPSLCSAVWSVLVYSGFGPFWSGLIHSGSVLLIHPVPL